VRRDFLRCPLRHYLYITIPTGLAYVSAVTEVVGLTIGVYSPSGHPTAADAAQLPAHLTSLQKLYEECYFCKDITEIKVLIPVQSVYY
jgi:hypothetical protein